MKKYLYSCSTETALNLEKSGVTCGSAGHVESQGQDEIIEEIEGFLNDSKMNMMVYGRNMLFINLSD